MQRTKTSPTIIAINATGLILEPPFLLLGVLAVAPSVDVDVDDGIELGEEDTVAGVLPRGIKGDAMAPSDPGLLGSVTMPMHF